MQWEYTTFKVQSGGFLGGKFDGEAIEEELNKLGRDGWELVSIMDTNIGNGASKFIAGVLKRALPASPRQ